jgi:hypothetical protein
MKLWSISLIFAASALVAGPVRAGHSSSMATQHELRAPDLPPLGGAPRPPPGAVWLVIFGVCSVGLPGLSPLVRPAPRSCERRPCSAFPPMTRRTS